MKERLRYRAKNEQPLLQLNYEQTPPPSSTDPLVSEEEKRAQKRRRDELFLLSDEFAKRTFFERLPNGVLDKQTLRLIQVDDLYTAINSTMTNLGAASLYRSLVLPPENPASIRAKQEAVTELRSNDALLRSLTDYLEYFQKNEKNLMWFLNNDMNPHPFERFPYDRIKKALRACAEISGMDQVIEGAESSYLKNLVSMASNYAKTTTHDLMKGPIYRAKKQLITSEMAQHQVWKSRFYPRYLSPAVVIFSAGFLATFREFVYLNMFLFSAASMSFLMKPASDYFKFLSPLRNLALQDRSFLEAMDGVAKLDELQSLVRFSKEAGQTVAPIIADEPQHRFQATDLRNPILGKNNPDFVPNDVDLHGINFITGPNSGGKSTISRTVVQSQLLAQIGSDILAKDATIVPAQKIAYQAPQYDALQDTEGRFGTELKRTRDIFFSIGSLSLVILDELAEGTTSEEKMQVSKNTLEGFHKKGGTVMLVTHNHELVEQFKQEGIGQDLQVEFNGEIPTHKIIPGISKVSHADRVARKIGFDKAAIEQHLKDEGYI